MKQGKEYRIIREETINEFAEKMRFEDLYRDLINYKGKANLYKMDTCELFDTIEEVINNKIDKIKAEMLGSEE